MIEGAGASDHWRNFDKYSRRDWSAFFFALAISQQGFEPTGPAFCPAGYFSVTGRAFSLLDCQSALNIHSLGVRGIGERCGVSD